jgi:uncharacterized protein YegL
MSRFIPGFISRMFSSSEETQPEHPFEYICPLSGKIMSDPVIASNGITYDRSSIVAHFSTFDSNQEILSPADNVSVIERTVFPNVTLREKIRQYASTSPNILLDISHSMSETIISENGSKTLVLTILPNSNAIHNKPKGHDIIFVLDVSGSMGTGVIEIDAANGESGFKLSRLDLVKHATLATSKMLGPNDNLCIITYSTFSKVAMNFTAMNEQGKSKAADIIKRITEESSTEFRPAIKCAFENIRQNSSENNHSSILFLTDGEPNDKTALIMEELRCQMGNIQNTTLSTFIFGNNADSDLLKHMSEVGMGMYSYIPDASMLGTVFSNFIANVKDTVIPCAKITITKVSGCQITNPNPVIVSNIHSKTPKNICFELTRNSDQPFEIGFTIEYNNAQQSYNITNMENKNALQVAIQNMRKKFIKDLVVAVGMTTSSGLAYSQHIINDLKISIKTLMTTYPTNPFLDGMLRDLESSKEDEAQITKAFSQMNWYYAWGKHYALSVARANELEETSNYKTPSIAPYANSDFIRMRDLADSTFVTLPPPEPSIKPMGRGTYVPSANATSNLAANLYGGCVAGDCIVDTTRGLMKISELMKGDQVFHSRGKSTVMCLVEHYVGFEEVEFIATGRDCQLTITPWHPIRIPETGNVLFPMEYHDEVILVKSLKSVFNIVMVPGDEPWYNIGGIDCVSVGHGNMEDPVLKHPYYAEKILDDLKLLEGWDNGYVVMNGKKMRDNDTGLVSGYL